MSSSSTKLQDEVPGKLIFVVAAIDATHAKPGQAVYKSYLTAKNRAATLNKDRELSIMRKRKPHPVLTVFGAFLRRLKDLHYRDSELVLVRGVELKKLSDDDALAYTMQEKMMAIRSET